MGMIRSAVLVIALSMALSMGLPVLPAGAAAAGQWQPTGALAAFHGNTALATLRDGKVLAISGPDGAGGLTARSELYDPATGAWSPTGDVNDPRMAFHHPVVLADGRVLIAGGHDRDVNDFASAELYDPATGRWTRTGSLGTSRRYAVTVGLADGRVLVATGAHGVPDGSRFLASAELYDPATGQWTLTGSAATRRESATGIRLRDGRVIVVGGYTCCDYFTPATDVFDPATGTWSQAGDRPHGGLGIGLVVLPDGRVLLVGGGNPGAGLSATTDALLFDPATGQWAATAPLHYARSGADAVVLPNGKVLVAGGGAKPSELYDPATGTWSDDADLAEQHSGAKMALLANGSVLIAGGYTDGGTTTASELYSAVAPPGPRADFTTTVQDNGRGIAFDASASTVPAGTTATYRWDFDNDGTVDRTTTGATTIYTYPDTRPRQATLTVVDSAGHADAITKPVTVPVDTVLVLLPGLVPIQTLQGMVPAYTWASVPFGGLLKSLDCVDSSEPSITRQCNTTNRARVYWSPYSYLGPAGQGVPKAFSGADSQQALGTSAQQLDQQIGQILLKHPGARLVLVGYSNGGTVATRWAGERGRRDVPVITLASPAYGFWPEDKYTAAVNEDTDHYCPSLIPWQQGVASPTGNVAALSAICHTFWTNGAYRSPASYDWRGERAFGQTGGLAAAGPLQLFSATNRGDLVAPPWWNVSPVADRNTIVDCTDVVAGHLCVTGSAPVYAGVRGVLEATVKAAKQRNAPAIEATVAGWGPTAGPDAFDGSTTVINAPANARIVAVGVWGPTTPGADGARHGDDSPASTLTCALRPSSPAATVQVTATDWRARSYVVFWHATGSPNALRRTQVRVLPYVDAEQYTAPGLQADTKLAALPNPCPTGGSS